MVSIERELASGTLHRVVMADLSVRRQLRLITHPARYCSRASAAFRREILPVFAKPWMGWNSLIAPCAAVSHQLNQLRPLMLFTMAFVVRKCDAARGQN